MTNAEKYVKDIDRLADAIYRTDDYDEACNLRYDETDELIGCRHDGTEKGCIICIKEWLMKEED
ncbi:MAG: hypothetical protein K0R92_2925 [Lachnospiraceae bacterium]|jgi:hypothetical protein|nr:hypothetical protein [Lachnospiraceae bacterium]